MPQSAPALPRPAAAVVLVREQDDGALAVFMVRRHVRSDFAPDVFVFPGGSVAAADIAAERGAALCAPAGDGPTMLGHGFRVAALRECFEEAGVLLARRGAAPLAIAPEDVARFAAYRAALNAGTMGLGEIATREGLTLATDELLHWAHWITPESWPKRFDTHFFLAAMPARQVAAHDRLEATDGVWVTPDEALSSHHQDRFPLVFATLRQLQALAGLRNMAAARERFAGQAVRTIQPRVVRRNGEDVILLPDEP